MSRSGMLWRHCEGSISEITPTSKIMKRSHLNAIKIGFLVGALAQMPKKSIDVLSRYIDVTDEQKRNALATL